MNIFQRIKSGWGAFTGSKEKTAFPIHGSANFFSMGLQSDSQLLAAYEGWVYACVRAISEEVANIELNLFVERNGEVEQVDSHPSIDALKFANAQMTEYDLFEATQSYLELMGRAYWFLAKSRRGEILGIFPLRPDYVSVVGSDNIEEGFIKGYVYSPSGVDKIPLDKDEVIFFKNFNPLKPYTEGYSTLKAAALAVDTDKSSAKWNKLFFDNEATPSGILQVSGELTETQFNRLRNEWNKHHQGLGNSHKTAILEAGMDYKPISMSHTDMDFLEQRRFSRDEILGIYRVPKTVLGLVEDVNRASAETTDFIFANRVIDPKMKKLTNTLNELYLPLFSGTENMFFDYVSPITENEIDKITRINTMVEGGWMTINEARTSQNLPPVENGNTLYQPLNLVPVGEVEEVEQRSVKPSAPKKKSESDSVKQIIHKEMKEAIDNLVTEDMKETFWKQFSVRQERFQETLEKKVRTFLRAQEKRVLANYDKRAKQETVEVNEDMVVAGIDTEAEAIALAAVMTPLLISLWKEENEATAAFFGLNTVDFNEQVQKRLERDALKAAKEINGATAKEIKKQIKDGVANNESVQEVRKRITTKFDFITKTRAEMIARTETTRATQRATLDVYKSNGVVKKVWFTAVDERVCQWCGPMNGRTLAVAKPFFEKGDTFTGVDGGVLKLDFSSTPAPPLHPSCRCVIAPVIE